MSNRKPISKELRFRVLERDGFTCQYCGRSAPDVVLHVDHVVPVAEGGVNHLTNLVTACIACNLGKHARQMDVLPPSVLARLPFNGTTWPEIRAELDRAGFILTQDYVLSLLVEKLRELRVCAAYPKPRVTFPDETTCIDGSVDRCVACVKQLSILEYQFRTEQLPFYGGDD